MLYCIRCFDYIPPSEHSERNQWQCLVIDGEEEMVCGTCLNNVILFLIPEHMPVIGVSEHRSWEEERFSDYLSLVCFLNKLRDTDSSVEYWDVNIVAPGEEVFFTFCRNRFGQMVKQMSDYFLGVSKKFTSTQEFRDRAVKHLDEGIKELSRKKALYSNHS